MSSEPHITRPPVRHALGLPAGSVRALLAFGVLGLSWALVLHDWSALKNDPDRKLQLPLEFIYLQFLAVLILAHFFAAHGGSIGPHVSTRSPLGLPRGSVRLLLVLGYGGLALFLFLHGRVEFTEPLKGSVGLLLLLLLTSFFVGYLVTMAVNLVYRGLPYWFQDIQAWVALLALVGLSILALIHIFINPTIEDPVKRIELPQLEAGLAALVGFYFGARS